MAKLHQAVMAHSPSQNLLRKVLGKRTYDNFHPIGASLVNAAKPPDQPAVTPMPDEDMIQAAKRRANASLMGRTGRASTILSDTTDRLGP